MLEFTKTSYVSVIWTFFQVILHILLSNLLQVSPSNLVELDQKITESLRTSIPVIMYARRFISAPSPDAKKIDKENRQLCHVTP